jgi:hypothetical protein
MPYIKWGGKKIYLEKPKPYVPDINELMKPLSEKVNKGNIWGSIIMKVPTPEVFKFDPDYQEVLDYASTLSGVTLPEYSQQLLQNDLVISWKSSGFWDKAKSIGVFATNGNDIFALVDWKRLTTMTLNSTPVFTADKGFKGDGIGAWINTNFAASNLSSNDASVGVHIESVGVTPNSYIIGNSGVVGLRIRRSMSNNNQLKTIGTTSASVDMSGAGFKMISKISSGNLALHNGTIRTPVTATDGASNADINLLRWGTTAGNYSDDRISFYFAGDSIDGTMYTDMSTIYLNYFNSL